jgi:transposase-like protein
MSKRKHLTPEQKVAIVRRHLLEQVPVSDLCDEYGIHATQYYAWQKQLFEQGSLAFERKTNKANQKRQQTAQAKKIEQLEEKLQKKNEVVSELLEEHVQLKKELGEP